MKSRNLIMAIFVIFATLICGCKFDHKDVLGIEVIKDMSIMVEAKFKPFDTEEEAVKYYKQMNAQNWVVTITSDAVGGKRVFEKLPGQVLPDGSKPIIFLADGKRKMAADDVFMEFFSENKLKTVTSSK